MINPRVAYYARKYTGTFVNIVTTGYCEYNSVYLRTIVDGVMTVVSEGYAVEIPLDTVDSIEIKGVYLASVSEERQARAKAAGITRRLRRLMGDEYSAEKITSVVGYVAEDRISITVGFAMVYDEEAVRVLNALKDMAETGEIELRRYSRFDATVLINTEPAEVRAVPRELV